MRSAVLVVPIAAVVIGACSSGSNSAGSCGDVAACYDETISEDPGANCGSDLVNGVTDFSALTHDGTGTGTSNGNTCTTTLSACRLTADCTLANGNALHYDLSFTASGYTGTISDSAQSGTTCTANVSAARLPDCSAVGGDGGTSDGGSCANPCGSQCCDSNSICFDDGAGNRSCATKCTDSAQCPSAASCCGAVGANGQCSNTGDQWACIPSGASCTGTEICRCKTGSECTTGACAPHVDPATLEPVGPYVCKPNDGNAYNGCVGATTTCSGNYCCVADTSGNQFCATACTNASQCGGTKCESYNFSHTTCSGPTACGP